MHTGIILTLLVFHLFFHRLIKRWSWMCFEMVTSNQVCTILRSNQDSLEAISAFCQKKNHNLPQHTSIQYLIQLEQINLWPVALTSFLKHAFMYEVQGVFYPSSRLDYMFLIGASSHAWSLSSQSHGRRIDCPAMKPSLPNLAEEMLALIHHSTGRHVGHQLHLFFTPQCKFVPARYDQESPAVKKQL